MPCAQKSDHGAASRVRQQLRASFRLAVTIAKSMAQAIGALKRNWPALLWEASAILPLTHVTAKGLTLRPMP